MRWAPRSRTSPIEKRVEAISHHYSFQRLDVVSSSSANRRFGGVANRPCPEGPVRFKPTQRTAALSYEALLRTGRPRN